MSGNILSSYEEYAFSIGDAEFTFFMDSDTLPEDICEFHKFHSHSYYELFYMLKGTGKIYLQNEILILNKGDSALVPPGLLHETTLERDSGRIVLAYTMKKQKTKATGHLNKFQTIAENNVFFCSNFVGGHAFERFAQYYYSAYNDKEELFTNCLREVIILLNESANPEKENSYTKRMMDSPNYRNYIIAQFFTNNFINGTLTELAKSLYISTQQTERLVKKLYNRSFREHLLICKMEYAMQLLETTDMTSEEISAKLGYVYPHSFLTAFKKLYNKTPIQYRKEFKKNHYFIDKSSN